MMGLAERLGEEFRNNSPFPHVVIDNFLPEAVARKVAAAYPGIDDIPWQFEGPGDSAHTGNKHIEKVSTSDEEQFPPYVRHMMTQFQSGIFCGFLDKLTGYKHLAPDPSHFGCGLHSTDIQRDSFTPRVRRVLCRAHP